MNPMSAIWKPAPTNLELHQGDVHIWLATLKPTATPPSSFRSILSKDELERADRFHRQENRDHWITSRGLLRITLGNYLNSGAADIEFEYSKHGKPSLLASQGESLPLSFNLSHSGPHMLCAVVAGERELGVDIEFKSRNLDYTKLADRFFSKNEVTALKRLSRQQLRDGFYNCWTCKEAFVKAKGNGLSLPLADFDVTFLPDRPAKVNKVEWHPDEAGQWSLTRLGLGSDYAGALAIKGKNRKLKYWRMDDSADGL